MTTNKIISPEYYKDNGNFQCWEVMQMLFDDEHIFADHCLLTAFKYLWRAGSKDDFTQDLNKAFTYLNKAKETCEFYSNEETVYNILNKKYEQLRNQQIEKEADGAD